MVVRHSPKVNARVRFLHPLQNKIIRIVLKADQGTGALTRGIVAEILTSSAFHPHGIKIRLEDGRVGRVQNIILKK